MFIVLPVTKPDSNDFFVETETVADHPNLLRSRLRVSVKRFLESDANRVVDRRSLLPTFSDHVDARRSRRRVRPRAGTRTVDLVEPPLEQRFELAHVSARKVEGLEPGNCRLRKVVAIHLTHRWADIALSVTYWMITYFSHISFHVHVIKIMWVTVVNKCLRRTFHKRKKMAQANFVWIKP